MAGHLDRREWCLKILSTIPIHTGLSYCGCKEQSLIDTRSTSQGGKRAKRIRKDEIENVYLNDFYYKARFTSKTLE